MASQGPPLQRLDLVLLLRYGQMRSRLALQAVRQGLVVLRRLAVRATGPQGLEEVRLGRFQVEVAMAGAPPKVARAKLVATQAPQVESHFQAAPHSLLCSPDPAPHHHHHRQPAFLRLARRLVTLIQKQRAIRLRHWLHAKAECSILLFRLGRQVVVRGLKLKRSHCGLLVPASSFLLEGQRQCFGHGDYRRVLGQLRTSHRAHQS